MNYKEVLENINWFSTVGEKVEDSTFEFPVQQAKNVEDCIKNINSLKWENFVLYTRNRLSAFVQHFHKDEYKRWNEAAAGARSNADTLKPSIQAAATSRHLPDIVVTDVRSILISYQIENFFSHLTNPSIPQSFQQLIEVYKAGKIPCGWNGKLPKNEGHEPINFNEGKIIVW